MGNVKLEVIRNEYNILVIKFHGDIGIVGPSRNRS